MQVYHPNVDERNDAQWAWSLYRVDDRSPWNRTLAGHLYRRSAFGPTWGQLQQALAEGPQGTVDRLLRPPGNTAEFTSTFDAYERSAVNDVKALRAWWLRRMMESPFPLQENLTLFWHNHFATGGGGLGRAQTMVSHIQGLRLQALGSFRDLAQGIMRDPAVYVWLGAVAHRRKRPEDRFVRALIENFTLGASGDHQKDLIAAARAWSGWFVYRDALRFIEREKDPETKTFLGQSGPWQRDDILRILLEQRATAERIVRKLYRWFISETAAPDAKFIAPLVDRFVRDYDIKAIVETMLRSRLFFSTEAYRQRVKSPVDYAVGLIRSLEATVSTTLLADALAQLGQDLCFPPTVHGWAGARHWISSATLVGRANLAWDLLSGQDPYGDKLRPEQRARAQGHTSPEAATPFLYRLLLQGDDESQRIPEMLEAARQMHKGQEGDDKNLLRAVTYALVKQPEFHIS